MILPTKPIEKMKNEITPQNVSEIEVGDKLWCSDLSWCGVGTVIEVKDFGIVIEWESADCPSAEYSIDQCIATGGWSWH